MSNYRKAYFSLLDKVVKETGNSKYELHEKWKSLMFPFLQEDPENFINQVVTNAASTVCLSEKGWETFYKEWQLFCIDKFGISY